MVGTYIDGSGHEHGVGINLPPPPPPPTPTSAMIMRDGNNGDYEIYSIGNNTILTAAALGQVGVEWTVAGFGSFSGNAGESDDMLLRDGNTGQFEVYDISNNAVTSAAGMGQVGMEWAGRRFRRFLRPCGRNRHADA